jgi:hypothetical protein
MALIDVYNVRYNYPTLKKRVTAQCWKSAQDILVESSGTTNHANRLLWAQATLSNPNTSAEKLMTYVASNATVLGYTSPNDTTDNDIAYIVASNINNIAQ